MKFWSVIAASLLMLGGLAACGDDETSAYCNNLKKFQAETESIQDADQQNVAKAMDEAASTIKDASKSAPDEIKEDWDSLSAMLSGDLDLSGDGDGKQISPKEIQAARDNIVEHARDTCDIELEIGRAA